MTKILMATALVAAMLGGLIQDAAAQQPKRGGTLVAGGLDKLPLYAALGVGEVWVWRGGALRVFVAAEAGGFVEVGASRLFPGLDLQQLLGHLDRPTVTQAQREYRRALRGG